MFRRLVPIALAAALAPLAAHAQPTSGVFSAVTWTSDYRYQGVSSTDKRPALQAYVHWQRFDGVYAGVFASQVHYYDGGPRLEIDVYAGKHFALPDHLTELTVEVMQTTFPDNPTPGPTFDFTQLKGAAKRQAGPWTLTATATFTPQASYGAGEAWLAQGEADYAVTPRLALKALVGRRWVHRGADRTFWSLGTELALGGSAQLPRYRLALRYENTNIGPQACGFNPRICDPAVVGSLSLSLPPLYFGGR